ncbi:hypothetical protein NMY22_g1914 [Coprinellus aureogranulatus]|nr:hypothetical protein NMY22_g1914 [Coprinellus aureogranulatus]
MTSIGILSEERGIRNNFEAYSAELRKDMNLFARIRAEVEHDMKHSKGATVTPGAGNLHEQIIALHRMITHGWPQMMNPDNKEMVRRTIILSHYSMLLAMCVRRLSKKDHAEYSRRSIEERKLFMKNLKSEYLREPKWPDLPNSDLQEMIKTQKTHYRENLQKGPTVMSTEPLVPIAMSAHTLPPSPDKLSRRQMSEVDIDQYIHDHPDAVAAQGKMFMIVERGPTNKIMEIFKVHEIVQSRGQKYAYLGFYNTGGDAIRFLWQSFKNFLNPGESGPQVDVYELSE